MRAALVNALRWALRLAEGEGDQHRRLTKAVLAQTFPKFPGGPQ